MIVRTSRPAPSCCIWSEMLPVRRRAPGGAAAATSSPSTRTETATDDSAPGSTRYWMSRSWAGGAVGLLGARMGELDVPAGEQEKPDRAAASSRPSGGNTWSAKRAGDARPKSRPWLPANSPVSCRLSSHTSGPWTRRCAREGGRRAHRRPCAQDRRLGHPAASRENRVGRSTCRSVP